MMLTRKFHVKKDERALLFKEGDFEAVLDAGEHRYFDPLGKLTLEKFTLAQSRFEHRLADYLQKAEPEMVAREFQVVEIGAQEVGLRYENGVLAEVLAPNTRRLYWKGYVDVRVDKLDVSAEFELARELVPQLVAPDGRGGFSAKVTGASLVYGVMVPQYQVAVLYVDGKVYAVLQAGMHAWWRAGRDIRADIVDLRMQVLEVAGQEILTRDKVALRVNLTAGYRISDVLAAYARQAKPLEYLYKELQFGLRAAVGTRTLDELLEDKGVIDAVVGAHIRKRVEGYGLEVDSVGVKDIILPGEMKVLLAKVVEAEKAAQANVIRRREETAATRSLLNTAKVMEDNPVALRLKELETLEKVTEKIDKISVFGGLDGVLKDLVKIR
ncbi:MAG TPA: slipin family protein [Burkholderiales bacterium]|jgi:regulator of protease activity HflC (stomatin/prohibitin superfamily)|nr:slipin family protein [Burkholderiales bacterium]